MSLYDPPSDPFYVAHECHNCDQPLRKEWDARDADWICVNPQCESSTTYKGNDPEYVGWCKMCETWVKRSELVRWTGDDALHYLCPGCDSDMVEVQSIE